MITKQTRVNQIEVTEGGAVNIRLGLYLVEDEKDIDCKWHRASVGDNLDAQFESINLHLLEMGYPPVSANDIARVKSIMNII